eukprot:2438252-Amphidinium_carterae.1
MTSQIFDDSLGLGCSDASDEVCKAEVKTNVLGRVGCPIQSKKNKVTLAEGTARSTCTGRGALRIFVPTFPPYLLSTGSVPVEC